MQYGICHLSIVPIRANPEDSTEMVSQLLYGEHFKVLENRKRWSKIRVAHDRLEGWIHNNQFTLVSEKDYQRLDCDSPSLAADIVSHVCTSGGMLLPVVLGSVVSGMDVLGHTFEGYATEHQQSKSNLVDTALLYLNTPYLWGGKTPFGIDCSGFAQMVYKMNGYVLKRDAGQQSQQGEPLSFIEESEPGDLAFLTTMKVS